MHRVTVLALDGVIPFDLGIPARVFGAARDATGAALYELTTCSLTGGAVRTSGDYSIVVDHGAGALTAADTVVIATQQPRGRLYEDGVPDEDLATALAGIPEVTRIVSICTGSYVLAATGLLDGRPATTHWRAAEHFQRLFPRVRVDPRVLFIDDGRVLTSAGAAAGIDLCLHVIRSDHGSEIANATARVCVVPPWREGGQAQYIERPLPDVAGATTAPTREWALARLREPLTLTELARHGQMSVRTFTRRFRAEVGMSANRWITQQRVDHARRLLETSDLPVESIAHETGFGSATALRQHFRAAISVSPTAYRRTFRAAKGNPVAA
ncbi:MAG: helix-turn-helix domain-containing protein [Actinomycetota bacterium]|nr:helix-turn-helix domain-containing protein [Actinomycetota bacterium]